MTGGHFGVYLGAFAAALGVLVTVHELGHFLVARLCGVKVLRFSVGFGRPLLVRRFGADQTEWAISMFPLGGYVKMLDEREGPVEPGEWPRAFNRQPVWKRILVVIAGPLANLLLAVLLYWIIFLQGMEELRPVLAAPSAATPAAVAGVEDGETVRSVNGKPIATWQELRWELMQVAIDRQPVILEVIDPNHHISTRRLEIGRLSAAEYETDVASGLGLRVFRPQLAAIIGAVSTGSAAESAGLRIGDEIIAMDGQEVRTWGEVSARIRQSAGVPLDIDVRRDGAILSVPATPARIEEGGQSFGRMGIQVRDDPAIRERMMITVRYAAGPAFIQAAAQTWNTSVFSLKMIGRMIAGDVSWKNLSGPVTIADYAGQSARMGWSYYLKFLALISISLGVLNLLPIPILDGGHLLYYIAEIVKGGPLSERVMEIGQQIGLCLLVLLMAFAFYNDINRLVSG